MVSRGGPAAEKELSGADVLRTSEQLPRCPASPAPTQDSSQPQPGDGTEMFKDGKFVHDVGRTLEGSVTMSVQHQEISTCV
ncbi:hypothetical protein E2C01_050981 [Portunus trituberculatus]|uniref:Uncharacterized protein n=1 Tax=Portunus trituberculatus TaxID=210409 RepID=A0A5B7GDJ3_PORTR|nr:hypothetical protein [Portunus trituberculatus]